MKRTVEQRRNFIKSTATTAAGLTVNALLPKDARGANDRLRVGLSGCGGRGNYLLGETFKSVHALNVKIVARCDVWKLNLERTAARLGRVQKTKPQTFARYGDLLASKDLDAVATRDFAHTQLLIEATKLKKDAFVEKPMAMVLDHARTALKLVREQQTMVQIGVQRRSDPRHQAGAKLIQAGLLGQVSEIEAAWHDAAPRWARDYSDVKKEDVDWEQYLMFLPKEPFNPARFRRWHLYEDFTTGTPSLLGSHLMDVAIWFMGDPLPLSAVAHGGIYVWKDGREHADTIDCLLEFPKGFILNYSTRLSNNKPVPEVIFYGTRRTFDTESWTARGEGGGKDAIKEPVTVPKPAAPATTAAASGNLAPGLQINDQRVSGEGHVHNWLECVRAHRTPNAPLEVGYTQSVASIMCLQAWESGRRQMYDAARLEIKAG